MDAAETVTEFIRAIERKDLDAAAQLVAPDLVYDNVPLGTSHGASAMVTVLGPFLEGVGAVQWVVHHQVAEGDVVMNERTDRFERPDGTWIELPVAGLFVLRDGKIALWRDYFDAGTFRSQMSG
jgi:limonene-1,2-epoxide hydrolase